MALAGPNLLVTLVPAERKQGLCFHYRVKLQTHGNAVCRCSPPGFMPKTVMELTVRGNGFAASTMLERFRITILRQIERYIFWYITEVTVRAETGE